MRNEHLSKEGGPASRAAPMVPLPSGCPRAHARSPLAAAKPVFWPMIAKALSSLLPRELNRRPSPRRHRATLRSSLALQQSARATGPFFRMYPEFAAVSSSRCATWAQRLRRTSHRASRYSRAPVQQAPFSACILNSQLSAALAAPLGRSAFAAPPNIAAQCRSAFSFWQLAQLVGSPRTFICTAEEGAASIASEGTTARERRLGLSLNASFRIHAPVGANSGHHTHIPAVLTATAHIARTVCCPTGGSRLRIGRSSGCRSE